MSTGDSTADDVHCMDRLKSGDDLALNELMDRWQQPLVAFTLRYTGNAEDALDLAQETFARIYESRGRYEPTAKFSTWMFTIATNLCRNLSRWRERHPTVSLSAPHGDDDAGLEATLPAPGETPADSAERHDLACAVRQHIQELPHDLKTSLLLFVYHDLGYEEIAAAVGCTSKAVETRLYRARHILKESLSRYKIEG